MDNLKDKAIAVNMKGITKKFGTFTANKDIDLMVHKGEIHALLGENGAGKSTLMNILYGLYEPTQGQIYINEKLVNITNPNIAISEGIGMVHQHFMLIETFTVVENIMLGMETTKGIILDEVGARNKVEEISKKYGLSVNPDALVQDISVGMQQRVEILKALYRGADILILDEPTAVLTPQEIEELIKIIKNLSDQGKSIIIITHKLKEIKAIADKCTIIRRGEKIDTVEVRETSEDRLAEMMVGRAINFTVDKKELNIGKKALTIENLIIRDVRQLNAVNGLSLELNSGEILGIAGVDGNGQSELIEGITGLRKVEEGKVIVKGKDITNNSPFEIINSGISTIPEDRQRRGLVLEYSIAQNMILENYYKDKFSKNGVLKHKAIKDFSDKLVEKFDIRPKNSDYLAGELSGGNQQKVIIAREITNDPEVLIAAQPTRGLDVGAIEYVHQFLVNQRDTGKAVLLISFELEEVLKLSDRIAVIYNGKIVEVLDAKDADEKRLGLLMAGGGGDIEEQ